MEDERNDVREDQRSQTPAIREGVKVSVPSIVNSYEIDFAILGTDTVIG